MKRLAFLSLFLASVALARPVSVGAIWDMTCADGDWTCLARRATVDSPSLLLLSPGQVAVSPLPCTAAGQLGLLTAPSACLNGDGTQVSSSGMTLSAVGSPTTQTMAWAPNGSNNEPVSRKRWTTSDSYQTASLSAPTGDFSVCHVGMVDAPLSAVTLVSGPGYSLSVSSAGVATFTSGGSSVSSASGAVIGGADQVICGTRSGTSGTVSVGGVRTSGTVAAPSGSVVVKVGGFVGGTRGAFVSGHLLTQTDETRLVAALVPVPQTATGQLLSNSRNSATWVTTSGGALVALPPGRTGVVGPPGETGVVGGVVSSPARTNLLTYSEQVDNAAWSKSNATVTANAGTAPDGAHTADDVSNTASSASFLNQTVNLSLSTTYTRTAIAKAVTGTGVIAQEWTEDGTTYKHSDCNLVTGTATGTGGIALVTPLVDGYFRCDVTFTTAASGTPKSAGLYVGAYGATSTATTISVAALQVNQGQPLPYCRSGATQGQCDGDVVAVAKPAWLSVKEGCVAFTLTPTWSGAYPDNTSGFILNGNAAGSARFAYLINTISNVYANDGTHSPGVIATVTAGHRLRFVTRWSASGNFLRVDNLTTGAVGTPTAFSGFSSFDSTIRIGSSGADTQQPLGSIISDVEFGRTPFACGTGAGGTIVASPGFAAWGDSLTEGAGSTSGNSYPSQMSARLGGRATYNGGIGGQTSTQIAARQGGVVPTLSVSGDQIPTSGAVSVTALSVRLLSAPSNTTARTITGTLAGVPGTLARDSSDAYTFTRTASGSATACPPGTPFLVDTSAHSSWAQVLWYGRNNYSSPEQVQADIAASIAAMPQPRRFVVLSVLNGNYASEYEGGADYATITGLNNDLAALYPDNYIDVRALLVSHYDPDVSQDVADHLNDIPPSSLRFDNVHLNDTGYAYVAQTVADFIAGKGW